jgi:flagellar hook protein FlgE
MLRSMYSGISGMKNFQNKLDVIGNNISNVNTFGFKKGRTTFKDLVSQQLAGASGPQLNRGGQNPKQVGLGTTLASIDTIHTQGSLQTTGRELDLAISGDGFFVVRDGFNSMFTRAGNFYLDQEGNLVNADGLRTQGFGMDPTTGAIDRNQELVDMQINDDVIRQPKTNSFTFAGNYNINDFIDNDGNKIPPADLPENTLKTFKLFDQEGMEHSSSFGIDDFTIATDPSDNSNQYVDTMTFDVISNDSNSANPQALTVDFNEDGTVKSVNGSLAFDFTLSDNSTDTVAIDNDSLDFSAFTILNEPMSADVIGDEAYLESFNIDASGSINGVLSNGAVQTIGQLALADFNNPGGLEKSGSNLYRESNNAGFIGFEVAGAGLGSINSSSLEMSNVDLSEEFTEMIVAQRGFQSNTRIITTSDEILQELVNLKR